MPDQGVIDVFDHVLVEGVLEAGEIFNLKHVHLTLYIRLKDILYLPESFDPVLVCADLECPRTLEAYPFELAEYVSEIYYALPDGDVSVEDTIVVAEVEAVDLVGERLYPGVDAPGRRFAWATFKVRPRYLGHRFEDPPDLVDGGSEVDDLRVGVNRVHVLDDQGHVELLG